MDRNRKHAMSNTLFRGRGSFLCSLFCFLTGISAGAFLNLYMDPDSKAAVFRYLADYFVSGGSPTAVFADAAGENLLMLAVMFLAGLSGWGFPASFAALLYKGLALGFTCSLLLEELGGDGILRILTHLIPQNLLLIPILVLACTASAGFGLTSMAERRRSSGNPVRKSLRIRAGSYIMLFSLFAAGVLAASVLESILHAL